MTVSTLLVNCWALHKCSHVQSKAKAVSLNKPIIHNTYYYLKGNCEMGFINVRKVHRVALDIRSESLNHNREIHRLRATKGELCSSSKASGIKIFQASYEGPDREYQKRHWGTM